MKLAAILVMTTGCAQLLGLDNTKLEQTDAAVDAPGVCDGEAAACTSSTGRSACGQFLLPGGQPLRVAEPTGAACDAANVEGPCALQVSAVPTQGLFDGAVDGVPGVVDDCGRWAVPDIDVAQLDVAVRFSDVAGTYQPSARLIVQRDMAVGEDRGLEAFAVLKTKTEEWATQLSLTPDATATGYLVRYTTSTGESLAGEAVAVDSGSPLANPPGTIPWAAYFTGAFDVLDPAAMTTSESGTAFAGMPTGPFSLEGFRQGRRCKVENLKTVSNVLIQLVEEGC